VFAYRVEALPLASHETGGGRAFQRECDADLVIIFAGRSEAVQKPTQVRALDRDFAFVTVSAALASMTL
jgi:hypothetical protein